MRRKPFAWLILLLLLLAACGPRASLEIGAASNAWIDAPLSGTRVQVGTAVPVLAHASLASGVVQMELSVNGASAGPMALVTLADGLVEGKMTWMPPGAGAFALTVHATAADGAQADSAVAWVIASGESVVTPLPVVTPAPLIEFSADSTSITAGDCTFLRWHVSLPQPQSIELNGQAVASQGEQQVCPCQTTTYDLIVLADDKYVRSVTINVTGECVTSTPTPTPYPTPRPTDIPAPTTVATPTPTPQAQVSFWADATTIPAGSCTVLRWQTANVQAVFFDGQGVPGEGSHQTCPCSPETHTLDVLLRDGSHDIRTLTINVTGYCVTPTRPQDTTPPPAPVPIEPGSNDPNHPQELCAATVVLRWNAVSDPSGIQGYRVNLQWHNGSQWQSSEPYFIIYGTSVDVTQWWNQHLYFPFRWAVWAIDNAGNHGPQSEWRYFECVLE